VPQREVATDLIAGDVGDCHHTGFAPVSPDTASYLS
jgi:hypothetical protein